MVKFFPDQLRLKAKMQVLLKLYVRICMAVICEGNQVIESDDSVVEKAKVLLENDPITLEIVDKFYELNFTYELKAMIHFSLNHLLVIRELFACESFTLKKYPYFNQLEFETALKVLDTPEKQEIFKIEHEEISAEIASLINVPYDTMYKGGIELMHQKLSP